MGLNFGLFKKDCGRWDPDLKIAEHTDFYLRFKGSVVYTPMVSIIHTKERDSNYLQYRNRKEFYAMFMRKNGLTKVFNRDRATVLNGNSLKTIPIYRA